MSCEDETSRCSEAEEKRRAEISAKNEYLKRKREGGASGVKQVNATDLWMKTRVC